jgi:serine-type D-Ala-D-Ala carboxypeptidase/endopeptidase (penicillin-binding protein 4)
VTGRVVGDESRFDALRGGPASNFATSFWVGPLSGLPFNHGKTLGRNSRFQREPARYAAERFERELERAGVRVRRAARAGVTPVGAVLLGEWASPRMSVLARHTNRPSDNYMAETLLKDLGADHGAGGTTASGTEIARREASTFGANPTMVDGSGLSRQNRTTPRDVVELLVGMDESDLAEPLRISLAVAGESGTLVDRMRGTPAQGRCRAKTGTLDGVSNLAGYCTSRSGARTAFAILMSGSVWTSHPLQNRMAAVLARYRP